jgi:signal transduction histidine kinase
MTRRLVQRVLGRDREIVLAAAFLAMASYELFEMWMFELPGHSPFSLAIAVHALQVVLILGATAVILHAWRRKTAHEEALARMVEKVVMAQEEERRRVAYDVHDGIAQFIVSAKQHLDTCADLWSQQPARAEHELATGRDRLGRALVETRRVLAALRPSAIAADGLVGALRTTLDEMAQENDWSVGLRADIGPAPLPSAVETGVFRIFQEAVANAARHAGTQRVNVDLHRDGSWLVLDVRDHGRGFVIGGHHRGLGLSSMQERARLLGGSCVIESAPRLGTHLVVRVPLENGHRNGRDRDG